MLTLFSSLLGFLTAGVPKALQFYQDKDDKKHELEVMRMQLDRDLELQKSGVMVEKEIAEIELDRAVTEAQIRESEGLYKFSSSLTDGASKWVVNLRASVQPCVTYGLFGLLVLVEVFGMWYAYQVGVDFDTAITRLWEDHSPLWATIVAFWFGGRQFNTKRK